VDFEKQWRCAALCGAGHNNKYAMYTVYLIQSTGFPDKRYTGYTANLEKRLGEHNAGKVKVTKNSGPWEVKVAVQFKEKKKQKRLNCI